MPRYILLTAQDATILTGLFVSFALPFIVSFLKRVSWPDWAKWLLAGTTSLVLGYLTLVSTNALASTMSVVVVGSLLLSAATTWYHTWFKALGLENWLNPPDTSVKAAATEAGAKTEQAVQQAVEKVLDN